MHLIFDTETSGLPTTGLMASSPNFCRVMSIAMMLLDENLDEVASFSTLVKLDDHVKVNEGAFKAHGITKEMCDKYGLPLNVVIDSFRVFKEKSKYQIGHNIKFDFNRIQEEESILFGFPKTLSLNSICTMELMTPICKMPSKYPSKYKWPKLQEAYEFLFHEKFDNAHSALADIQATKRIYKYLLDNKILNLDDR